MCVSGLGTADDSSIMKLAIVAITPGGAKLARSLGRNLPQATVFLPSKFRQEDDCRYGDEPVALLLPRLFRQFEGLLCLMATGIVARILAPHLRGKDVDPAVVVMDEAGRFAISLLSGHLGGANRLAAAAARATGGEAVITTATDVNGLPAWDDIAGQQKLAIEPLASVRTLNALLLEGKPIGLVDRKKRVAPHFAEVATVHLLKAFSDPRMASMAGRVLVTHRHVPDIERHGPLLLLHPKDLVIGIGCNRGTSEEEIAAEVDAVLLEAFLSPASIGLLASVEAKSDEAGLLSYAGSRNLPIEFHSAARLNAAPLTSAPSLHALRAVGTRGVCEPAALLSAGAARLLVPKQKRGNVTVAVAERDG